VFDRFHRITGSAGDGAGLGARHCPLARSQGQPGGPGLRVRVVFPLSEADKL
jgi:hypothetical protein